MTISYTPSDLSISPICFISVATQTRPAATTTTESTQTCKLLSSLVKTQASSLLSFNSLNSSDGFTAKWVLCHAAGVSWSFFLHSVQGIGCFHSPIEPLPLHLLHTALSLLLHFSWGVRLILVSVPLLSSPICPSMADGA